MLEERKEAEAPNSSFCAMKMFQNKDRVGQELVDTALTTTHLNQICEMRVVSVDSGHHVESVSSCAGDGNIVIWDLNDLASKLQDLTL
jgi:SepF-like predicted cell division protein (DUF552 family)